MGKPMVLNLLKAGFKVHVLQSSAAAQQVQVAGAQVHASTAELCKHVEAVITMLPDSPEVLAAVTGNDGLEHHLAAGFLYIDMSTIAPSTAVSLYHRLKAKGIDALDAPVSGGQTGAESATLTIMVGGEQEPFSRALPLFQAMGKSATLIGPAGSGQVTKACNQIIVAMTIQAVSEAFILAKKAGVDLSKLREALLGGFAQSRILDLHGQRIIDRNFKPGFKVKLHRKDMNIALQAGREHAVPLFGSAQVASLMDALIAQGDGELDHSSIAKLLEMLSGID
jgi:2-hydroxy-3-oxopropionate reductase